MQQQSISEAMYYIMLSLLQPAYGYEMMKGIKELSGGRIEMGPGTLYGIISRMKKDGLIKQEAREDRRKIYLLTDKGKEVLVNEYKRLKYLVNDGKELEDFL